MFDGSQEWAATSQRSWVLVLLETEWRERREGRREKRRQEGRREGRRREGEEGRREGDIKCVCVKLTEARCLEAGLEQW